MSEASPLRGVVHGRFIELESDAGLPDGAPIYVLVQRRADESAPGEGLKRSFGGWDDDPAGLDMFLEWNRRQRKVSRREIES